ncbi:MAG: tRNA pseudouridine(38-40) synthase TruA [Nitriliruptoraceae bacterium]
MSEVRLRIDLAYDGAPFAGFARQPDQLTVQGTLESALHRLVGHELTTTGAGRTDRGVHARGQVVHVDLARSQPRVAALLADLDVMRERLDRLVGEAVTIWRVQAVPGTFDARFSAVARRYRYRLVDAAAQDPIRRHDRWHLGVPLDRAAMRTAADALIGEHDFASFCRRAPGRTTVRRIDVLRVSRPARGNLEVVVEGPAFCHQQVRSVVGCLVEVGRGRRDPGWLAEVLAARDRGAAARVAPPHGLTLERVSYGRGLPAAPPPWARAMERQRG